MTTFTCGKSDKDFSGVTKGFKLTPDTEISGMLALCQKNQTWCFKRKTCLNSGLTTSGKFTLTSRVPL